MARLSLFVFRVQFGMRKKIARVFRKAKAADFGWRNSVGKRLQANAQEVRDFADHAAPE